MMKKRIVAALVFVLVLALAAPALAASGWDMPAEQPGTHTGFGLTAEKYEYAPSVSGGYPANGAYFAAWDDSKGIVRDTRGRVVFTVTLPSSEDMEALYPGVNFRDLTLTFKITNVKGVGQVDLYGDPVDYMPDFLTDEITDSVFTHVEHLGKKKKSMDDRNSLVIMYVFAAASAGDVVASVSLEAGSQMLDTYFMYQSRMIEAIHPEYMQGEEDYGEWGFVSIDYEHNIYDGIVFDTDDSDKIQRLFLALSREEEGANTVIYQVLIDVNGNIAFKNGEASIQQGDDGYADIKAVYDFFMGALGFRWDGSVKYMNEQLIIKNVIPHASGKASVTFPGGYQAILTPTAMPPQTGDQSTLAGYAMLALAAAAAAVLAFRRYRA